MMVGFYKDGVETQAEAKVVAFCDRIWLRNSGDAYVFRVFSIRVDSASPQPLSAVKILIPYSSLSELNCQNESAFDPDFYYNKPGIRTTGTYQILSRPGGIHPDFGEIDDDKSTPLRFTSSRLSIYSIGQLRNAKS